MTGTTTTPRRDHDGSSRRPMVSIPVPPEPCIGAYLVPCGTLTTRILCDRCSVILARATGTASVQRRWQSVPYRLTARGVAMAEGKRG